uniref:Retrovirus-related Pol polyprotein from transposon TNT 1-94 n=1 Tax=Tanacetum cinerariifolium TaxID=118510 RepID=A0A6L2NWM6_TANCI|nr:retrovirus-related Pol polyprotein from transposon TNT 1-94 [Tanacetum cinerariifolium]
MGTVQFDNDQFESILGYEDLVQGNVMIKRVYYVEGLNYNLFSVGQFCNADLEVTFRKSTCFVRDLQGNDLITGTRGYDLYKIALHESSSPTRICFMAKASPTQEAVGGGVEMVTMMLLVDRWWRRGGDGDGDGGVDVVVASRLW